MTQDPLPPAGLYTWTGRRIDPDLDERIEQAHAVMTRARRNRSRDARNGPQDATGHPAPKDPTGPCPGPREAAS